jgi:hypothetical protein
MHKVKIRDDSLLPVIYHVSLISLRANNHALVSGSVLSKWRPEQTRQDARDFGGKVTIASCQGGAIPLDLRDLTTNEHLLALLVIGEPSKN